MRHDLENIADLSGKIMLARERLLPPAGGSACPPFSPGIDSSQLMQITGCDPSSFANLGLRNGPISPCSRRAGFFKSLGVVTRDLPTPARQTYVADALRARFGVSGQNRWQMTT
jgi:hypothetical protein